ncbi:MAG: ABC transporter ATP-binding protein [Streptococcus sp.]|nr:ABC transporter ATP-binding protein [Streptococcus sp.]
MKLILSLFKEIRVVKALFICGITLLILSVAGTQLTPLLLQRVIDGPLEKFIKGQTSTAPLLSGIAQYLLLLILSTALAYFSRQLLLRCANRTTKSLRDRAYQVMQSLPISYFDDKPAGKIATTIVNDTETLRFQFYGTLIADVFVFVLQILFIYGIVFSLNPVLGLYLLLLIPIVLVWQYFYKKLSEGPLKSFYEGRSQLNSLVNETINGIDILQLYHKEKEIQKEFEQTVNQMVADEDRFIFLDSTISWSLADFLKHMTIAGVLTMVGMQFLSSNTHVTAGLLFIYIGYMISLFDTFNALIRHFSNVQHTITTASRLFEFLNATIETDKEKELVVSEGVVDFQDVNFGYEKDKLVLSSISIHAEKGETIALVGHTGSGKSSIMNLLYRFYDPQSGCITIDGQNIQDYKRESVRNAMGIVLQDPYLFTGTLASNVSMGNVGYTDEMIRSALYQVGASKMLENLPNGINEEVTEKGSRFSSGERQLIAFARTLITNPKILILDEATSHIDTETEEIIQNAMEVLRQGRTTFIIAHRLSTIQNADQILVLDSGKIVERGNHQSLLEQNGQYAHMYRTQIKE